MTSSLHTLGMESDNDTLAQLRAQLQESQRLQWQTNDALNQARSGLDSAVKRSVAAELRAKGLQADALRAAATDRRCADLQRQLTSAQQAISGLERKYAQTKQQLTQMTTQLAAESEGRQRAVEAAARSDAERSRLQRARDEAASALRAAEARVLEAEEEVDRAEQDAASARAEMRLAHTGLDDRVDAHSLPQANANLVAAAQQQTQAVTGRLQEECQKVAAMASQAAAQQQQARINAAEAEALRIRVSELEAQQCVQQPAVLPPKDSPAHSHLGYLEEIPAPALAKDAAPDSVASSFVVVEAGKGEKVSGGSEATSSQIEESATGGVDEEVMAALRGTRRRAAQLKGARDRLLLEVDALSVQAEQLASENAVLSEALAAAQDSEAEWQQRAQSGLAHSEHLTELLSESAAWPSDRAFSHESEDPHQGLAHSTQAHDDALQALRAEQARVSQLQLQVNALVMELARCDEASAALGRATLPALGQVEAQLAAAVRMGVA